MLDGILDPMNVGNILRTAHFFGVDAVAVSTNTCCSLASSALAKASSGACEAIQLLALPKPSHFIYTSAKAGWRIYGSVAPPALTNEGLPLGVPAKDAAKYTTSAAVANSSPLAKHPVILMLGAEGEGLRDNLKNRADRFVSIAQGQRSGSAVSVGVDSVNVGVAAAVLVESFMRKPEGVREGSRVGELGF